MNVCSACVRVYSGLMQPCVTVKSAVCLLLKEHRNLMTVPPCVCLCARFYLCEDSLPIWKIRAFFLEVKIPFEKSENIKARTCSEK